MRVGVGVEIEIEIERLQLFPMIGPYLTQRRRGAENILKVNNYSMMVMGVV